MGLLRFFQLIPRYRAKIWQEEVEGVGLLEQATEVVEGKVMQTSPTTPTPFLRRTLNSRHPWRRY